ncbi:MAG: flippase [bacterium]|nr:flippase [bacterium]
MRLITPLITAPYLSRVLGADGIGYISYTESIVSYFVLFATLGITTYGQREISYVQNSIKKRSEVFWNTKVLNITTVLAVTVIYIVFSFSQNNTIAYLLFTFYILTVAADVSWFFQGIEEFGKILFRDSIFKLINIIYLFIVIRTKEDILFYIFGISFFSFIGNVSLWRYLPKYIRKIDKSKLHPFRSMHTVLILFVPTIAVQVYTVLDKTMIGVITQNSFENGYYEQAMKISKLVLVVVTSLGTVMIPRIGYYFQNGEKDTINQLMYQGYRFVWLLGIPLCIGLIMTAGNFVPWFFGAGYERAIPLMQILSLLILAIGISNVTGMQYLIPTKREKLFLFPILIGAAINFAMNLVLIRYWGAIGAAIASVTAETAITLIQFVIVRKELSVFRIVKESGHYVFAGMIMALVLYPMGQKIHPSILHTIMMISCGAIVYAMMLLIMRDEFFLSNIKSILSKIK